VSLTLCATCAVETASRPDVCPICADERQWVPADGQVWTTLDELQAKGTTIELTPLEPKLFALHTSPDVGIGQWSKLLVTAAGSVLWDPIGYLDDETVARVRELGDVVAIASSHPHMFGAQVEWSHALGGVPVLVADADRDWVQRPDSVIEYWSGTRELLPGVLLVQIGGHFPGSGVISTRAADGAGLLLAGDTVFPTPTARRWGSCAATRTSSRSGPPWCSGWRRRSASSMSSGCTATSTTSFRRAAPPSSNTRPVGTSPG
jgi:hypothetical protein